VIWELFSTAATIHDGIKVSWRMSSPKKKAAATTATFKTIAAHAWMERP
jgi:hypothetical protein